MVGDWVRDDLPDLIWPALILAEYGTSGALRFVRWQEAVQRDLGEATTEALFGLLDGRLTSLEKAADLTENAQSVIVQRAREYGLVPASISRAIASYPEHPAPWLFGEHAEAPSKAELGLVAQAIFEVVRDGHREALIKCLPIWSAVQAKRFSSDQNFIDVLKNYPNDESSRSAADTMIRASWGAQRGALLAKDPDALNTSIEWAKIFWGVNSMTSRCVRERELSKDEEEATASGGSIVEESKDPNVSSDESRLQQLMMDLMSSYCEALETAPSRLYDQERQEVHAGLVSRASREVISVLGSPDLWCMEHSAHITRTLVETRIYLQWMTTQDSSIYREYQEYGKGKAKLYARITQEVVADGSAIGVKEAVQEFERLSYNEGPLDHRVVDTRDSFAGGKSIRAMADECGLLDFYRRAYSISSGISHSEWWAIESNCLERCHNILHRGHLIPSLSLNAGGNAELARSWINSAYSLMRTSLDILGTEKAAVETAFEWLSSPESTGDEE